MLNLGRINNNLDGYVNIPIDRTTILGNYITKVEDDRNTACDNFQQYFDIEIENTDGELFLEIDRIIYLILSGKRVNLQCWCTPKRCHGLTYINYIKKQVSMKLWDW